MGRKNKKERRVPKNFDDVMSLAEYGYIYDDDIKAYPSEFNLKPKKLKVVWTQYSEQKIDEAFGNILIGVKEWQIIKINHLNLLKK